jgi:Pet100
VDGSVKENNMAVGTPLGGMGSVTTYRRRSGFYLEAWKFAVYLSIPLAASWYFNEPARQRAAADYWKFVYYPPNPNTNIKEQVEVLRKQQAQRKVYQAQMMELQHLAEKSRQQEQVAQQLLLERAQETKRRGWLGFIGLGKKREE